jgi:hypothetical protein
VFALGPDRRYIVRAVVVAIVATITTHDRIAACRCAGRGDSLLIECRVAQLLCAACCSSTAERLALHLSQELADDTDCFDKVTTGGRGIELHLELGSDEVAEVFDNICIDCCHHSLRVVAPGVTHVIEAFELETEGVKTHD